MPESESFPDHISKSTKSKYIPERRGARGPASAIDLNKTLAMIKAGCSYEEIGKVFGTAANTVAHQIRKYINDGINLDFFKQHRADIFASKQAEILHCLTPEKIEKASAYQLTGMMGIFYDKERLERNLSTSNIAYADLSRDMSEIDREIRRLEGEIGAGSSDSEIVDK